jgi:rod shape-determining protein MreD
MSADGTPRWIVYGLALFALVLSIVPLPRLVDPLRPDFLLLVVIGLGLASPRTAGLLFAFTAGLGLDAFRGVVLGQHAFAFVLTAYLVHRFHLRIRMFPLGHQSLTVLSLLFVYQFALFWIDGVTGHPVTHWTRWLPVVTGTLLWPVLSGFFARLQSHG